MISDAIPSRARSIPNRAHLIPSLIARQNSLFFDMNDRCVAHHPPCR